MSPTVLHGGVPAPLRFLLASASPRRTELLRAAGIPHTVEVAAVTEHEDPRTDPREMVLHNARLKAAAVARLHPDALVLGADTTVALGDRALNKPADLAELIKSRRRIPMVVTAPSLIFHRRNGPVISPYLSKETGPITPSYLIGLPSLISFSAFSNSARSKPHTLKVVRRGDMDEDE